MIWYINALFVIVMVTLTIIDVRSFGTIRHRDFKSIIVSTGILGTFFGIFWGLQGFDTTQIQDSVPHLLDGLKVAFFTSIAGMGLAIAISIYQKLQARKSDTEESIDYILEQVSHLDLLQNLNHLDKLQHLSAIEESQKNTVSAIQQFQSQQENQHTHLLESLQGSFSQTHSVLREAVEQLARGASEELIAALERVIQDFNQNLTDQFGDNFKKLNAAVGNMIEWQEHYRSSIEEIEKALHTTQKSMHQSEKTLETIAGRNSEVMATYEQLGEILSAHKQQTQDLNAHLQTFAALSDNSQTMFKRLDEGFQSVSDNFSTLLQEANTKGSELSGLIRNKVTDLHESFEYFSKTSTDRMNELQLTLEKTAQIFQGTMQKNVHDALSLQQEHTKGLQISHQKHSQKLLDTHDTHNTSLQEKLQQQYEWLNTQTDENLKNLADHVTQTHTTLAGHSQNLLNTHDAHNTALQEKLQQQYGWLNTQVNENLKNLSTRFTETQTTLASELQTRAQKLQEGFSTQLAQSLQQMTEAVEKGSGTQQELISGITERFTALQQHLNTLLESMSQTLQDSTQNFLSNAQQNLSGLTESCQKSFQAIEQQSTQSFATLTTQISQQTGQLFKDINDHAAQSHNQLQTLTQSLQQSQQNTAAFTEQLSAQIQQHFDASRGQIEKGLQITEQQLGATLQNIQQSTAQNMGQMSESVLKNLDEVLKELNSKLLIMQQQVLKNNSRLSTEYLKFLQSQIKESGELPKQITGNLKASLDSMQQLLEGHFQKSADQIEHHRSALSQVIDQTSRHFERELQHAGSMNTELNRSLTDLNQALSQMTNQFRVDYEWFLQRVRELMGNRGY